MKAQNILIFCISIAIIVCTGIFFSTQIIKPRQKKALGFGTTFTDHMFVMNWTVDKGWHNERIIPYTSFSLDPSSLHIHYGQAIFEGMKAFTTEDNKIVVFRPQDHLSRLNNSAQIMSMPSIDVNHVDSWLKKLIKIDCAWVPENKNESLYIRPTMIATQNTINLTPSAHYTFFIIMSPVSSFYEKGFNPVNIMVTENYTRSCIGGVGSAKAAGNYAASMKAQSEAHQQGCAQVLWLDPVERKYIEEVGTMNVFFVIDNTLVTPALTNTILSGITRKTVIEIAHKLDIPVQERKISIEEVTQSIENGTLTESFGTGTAVGIAPIGKFVYKQNEYTINSNITGPISKKMYDELMRVQRGPVTDKNNTLREVIE